MRIHSLIPGLLCLGALTACGRGETLEVRSFELQRLSPDAAARLIEPYIYSDRADSPGTLSVSDGAVTVRERPENLERIAAVLKKHDRAGRGVTLHFHILEPTDSTAAADVPSEIVSALQPVLRYPGYRLVTSSILQGTAGDHASQRVGDGNRMYQIMAEIADAGTPVGDTAASVRMKVALAQPEAGLDLLVASVNVPSGRTVVLGSARPMGGRAILLVVRPEVESDSS